MARNIKMFLQAACKNNKTNIQPVLSNDEANDSHELVLIQHSSLVIYVSGLHQPETLWTV